MLALGNRRSVRGRDDSPPGAPGHTRRRERPLAVATTVRVVPSGCVHCDRRSEGPKRGAGRRWSARRAPHQALRRRRLVLQCAPSCRQHRRHGGRLGIARNVDRWCCGCSNPADGRRPCRRTAGRGAVERASSRRPSGGRREWSVRLPDFSRWSPSPLPRRDRMRPRWPRCGGGGIGSRAVRRCCAARTGRRWRQRAGRRRRGRR